MSQPVYLTTSIPYVNAAPHVGFALELVLADALARYRRLMGAPTRLQSGTDDNSLKNVRAAARERVSVRSLVDRNAVLFQELPAALDVELDGFIRTSADAGHAAGAPALWQARPPPGDPYPAAYPGPSPRGCGPVFAPGRVGEGPRPAPRGRPGTGAGGD